MAPRIIRAASVKAQNPRYFPKLRILPSERVERNSTKYPAIVRAVAGNSARR
jgi:hypothetical protein